MKGYSLDPHPQANIAGRHFAVIYAPRKKRDRFPETIVTLYASKEEAMSEQDVGKKYFAAEVIGPAKSSEGCKLFYLLQWLE